MMHARLEKLKQTRGQYSNMRVLLAAIKEDVNLRTEIDALAMYYLNRRVSGCSNCYADAYLELVTLKDEKIMNVENAKFHLRAGVLLKDIVNYDSSKNMTNANITNELALYHLRTNPSCRGLFDRLPENVDALINGETPKAATAKRRKKKAE